MSMIHLAVMHAQFLAKFLCGVTSIRTVAWVETNTGIGHIGFSTACRVIAINLNSHEMDVTNSAKSFSTSWQEFHSSILTSLLASCTINMGTGEER